MKQTDSPRRSLVWRLVKVLSVLAILSLLAAGAAAYFGIPAVARTKWARARMERGLARYLGTPVQIGKVEASWRKGIRLHEISVQPAVYGKVEVAGGVRELRFKPDYGRLLRGKPRAEMVLVAPDLRIRELKEPAEPARPKLPRLCCHKDFKIEDLQIREGSLVVESGPSGEALRVEGLSLAGVVAAARDRIDIGVSALNARMNGGTLTGRGMFALAPGAARSSIDITGTGVESNGPVARALRYVLPLFETLPTGSVRGKVDLRLRAEGSAENVKAMLRAAKGEGAFLVQEADLRGARIFEAAGRALGTPALFESRFHEAEGLFTVREGRLRVLQALARGPAEVRLSGWVDLDGTLEYDVQPSGGALTRVTGTLAEPRAGTAGVDAPGEPH